MACWAARPPSATARSSWSTSDWCSPPTRASGGFPMTSCLCPSKLPGLRGGSMSGSRRHPLWCSSMGQRPPYERRRAGRAAWGPQLPESRQLVSDASFFHRHPLIRRPRGGMGSNWAVCYLFVFCFVFFFNQRDVETQFF